MQHDGRVTYDFQNRPIPRLLESRDINRNMRTDEETKSQNPLNKFLKIKQANTNYFKEADKASTFSKRVKVSIKHTKKENHPETHKRGALRAYEKFMQYKSYDNGRFLERPLT